MENIINLKDYCSYLNGGVHTIIEFMDNEFLLAQTMGYYTLHKQNQEFGGSCCSGLKKRCKDWLINHFQKLLDKDLPNFKFKVIWE